VSTNIVSAYECRHKAHNWAGTIVNALSASKARYQYFLDVSECWPDVRLIDLRVRKVGGPHTSDQFVRNAKYRGMPDVRCGQRVKAPSGEGVIVGHNSSANFDVLYTAGKWEGLTLNVHPSEIELIAEAA
jgi:hypothetical protein